MRTLLQWRDYKSEDKERDCGGEAKDREPRGEATLAELQGRSGGMVLHYRRRLREKRHTMGTQADRNNTSKI